MWLWVIIIQFHAPSLLQIVQTVLYGTEPHPAVNDLASAEWCSISVDYVTLCPWDVNMLSVPSHCAPPPQVVICGSLQSEDTRSMIECVNCSSLLSRLLVVHDGSGHSPVTKWLPPVQNMSKIDGKATAYVCKNFVCSQPVNTVDNLRKLLQQKDSAEN